MNQNDSKTPFHVLVVDDSRGWREIMKAIALEHGFECTTVDSSATARSALNRYVYDVVVVDIRLPDHTEGIDLAESILQDFPHSQVALFSVIETQRFDQKRLKAIRDHVPVFHKGRLIELEQFLVNCCAEDIS